MAAHLGDMYMTPQRAAPALRDITNVASQPRAADEAARKGGARDTTNRKKLGMPRT